MEKEFFDFDGWDQVDTMEFNFYRCVLNCDFGPYKKGDVLKAVAIDYARGEMRVYDSKESDDSGTPDWEGKLKLVLVNHSGIV